MLVFQQKMFSMQEVYCVLKLVMLFVLEIYVFGKYFIYVISIDYEIYFLCICSYNGFIYNNYFLVK